MRIAVSLLALLSLFPPPASAAAEAAVVTTEICVYGGTAAGVIAAVQAVRMGRQVVLVNPDVRLGGMTSGGLGQTDVSKKRSIVAGLARLFYEDIAAWYRQDSAWTQQRRGDYVPTIAVEPNETAWWNFEPHVAEMIFERYVREKGVTLLRRERLDLSHGVEKAGARIVAIRLESGRVVRAAFFIDASYEGDLLAKAGVGYRVGREANAEFGETINGVQPSPAERTTNHQLPSGISAYVRPGDRASGLLPGIDPSPLESEGTGDHRVQAYAFRLCLTDVPGNRVPFRRPADYDERDFEILFRAFEAGLDRIPWINSAMPNRKTDINNSGGISINYIGQNHAYPDADYATRDRIRAEHRRYQEGLMWTLANHPRVPESIRAAMAPWGLAADEFRENAGWPEALYLREARRMRGTAVMTEHHCVGRIAARDAVALGAYTMDSHNTRRYVDASGHVRNEGNVQIRIPEPYPIGYDATTPRADECENLLVPVCLSATHTAYCSIRMEPVFMMLGQSAATAAAQAWEQKTSVQQIDRAKLRDRLLADRQLLAWPRATNDPAPKAK